MFKNMKLGFKIGAGFASILVLSIALGSFCVLSMKNAQIQSNKLAKEYVPEVAIANNLERNSLAAMLAIRSYGFTEEESYLAEGRKSLQEVKKALKEANELADKYPALIKLKEHAAKAETNVEEYAKQVDETEKSNKSIDEARKGLDQGAKEYMGNCNEFLKYQNEMLSKEISSNAGAKKINERVTKVNLMNDVIDAGNAMRIAVFKSQALRDPAIIQDALKTFDNINKYLDDIKALTSQESNLAQIEEIRTAGSQYKLNMETLLKDWQNLQEIGKKRNDAASQVLEASQVTSEAGMKQTKNISSTAALALAVSSNLMVIGLIAAVAIGVLMAYAIVISITKPINRIVDGLNESAQQVSSASGQLSSSSQQLAEGSAEQAASIEETSSTLEESSSMVRQNTENTKQAALLAKQAKDSAYKGNQEMKEMITSMDELKKSSDEIAKIIKVIDEIAFQTNILALNAAVEAARAGEAGMGFAVVAEEVRNLAQRSAQAAKDTAGIIESNINLSVKGVDVSKKVDESLSEINLHAQKVNELLDEVAAASQEQAQGIGQISKAINQMEQVVQSNAATAEESASASEELSAQSINMKEIVNSLVQLVNGAGSLQEQAHLALMDRSKQHKSITTRKTEHAKVAIGAGKLSGKALNKKDTHVVNPEDVIPLEDDTRGF